jgi:hypothetical protein
MGMGRHFMLWILLGVISLIIVALAAYRPRFRRFAEPALSVMVAIGLISAFVVWWSDDNAGSSDPVTPVTADRPVAAMAPSDIRLENLVFQSGQTASSYVVTGTIHNDGTAFLDYFILNVRLEDCPSDACQPVGSDDPLVIARIAPGQSASLRTSLVVPQPRSGPPASPRWTTSVGNIQSSPLRR